jgi:hypothetical protein
MPIGLAYLLFFIPYAGKLLFAAVLVIEGLLIIGNDRGHRIGDEVAGTQVIDRNAENSVANLGG